MREINWKLVISMLGLFCMLGFSVLLYITFLFAYFQADGIVVIGVNMYGESHIEFILMPLMIAFGIYGLCYLFRRQKK